MDIRSIVVGLEVDSSAPSTVKAAVGLAQRFGASLTGIAAAEPTAGLIGFDGGGANATVYAAEREDIETRLRALEEQFQTHIPVGMKANWRAYLEPPTRSLLSAARSADLIVVGPGADTGSFSRAIDLGEFVLSAGRPVLALGAGVEEVWADKIVIGWKDTREARRAVADALPLLAKAREVVVVTVREGKPDTEQSSLDDVVSWLALHGITAKPETVSAIDGPADALREAATLHAADLLVTGGYGHSRTREWLFGGMTRDLLATPSISRFLSN
jgi:nucleotide-binding universal stress UspA family protein